MARSHRVLGILGSPRYQGNTAILLNQATRGASHKGAEVRIVRLNELDITPCQHCDKCLAGGDCYIEDGMQRVYSLLDWSNRLILASPIHFMGVTSQTKLMIDRCQVFWARKYHLKTTPLKEGDRRKGVFISVGAGHGDKLFQGALATVKALFLCLEVELMDTLVVPGIEMEGAICNHPDILSKAFSLGERLAGDGG